MRVFLKKMRRAAYFALRNGQLASSMAMSRWVTLTVCPSARRCAPSASLMATERCAPPVQPTAIISRRFPSR